MRNKNRKYNILIIENKAKSKIGTIEIYSEDNCKKIKIEDAEKIIDSEDFDFIYFSGKEQTIMKRFKDYELLPKAFEKFAINNDVSNTYIHCNVILDIISDNVKIIEIKGKFQESILEITLEKILYSRRDKINLEEIFIEMQQTFEKGNVKEEIAEVVYRNYAKSIGQIIKFHKNKEVIIRKFFNKLICNIQNDIQEMQGFDGNIKAKKIEVY